jgi:esterase/lipase superfamily enzyme
MTDRRIYKINSKALGRPMEMVVYGHYGPSLLLLPAITDSPYENEEAGMLGVLREFIDKGRIRVFSIPSVNFESWLNDEIPYEQRSEIHKRYNDFIQDELVPFIFSLTEGPSPIITVGAAIGAFHAANTYFRRPDIFYGTIAMSGTFNIEHFTKGFFDSNCYFNSPIHYLSNLDHPYWMSLLQSKRHIYILSGSGENEFPENTLHLSEILKSKNIRHFADIWGREHHHCFDTWNKMLVWILNSKAFI